MKPSCNFAERCFVLALFSYALVGVSANKRLLNMRMYVTKCRYLNPAPGEILVDATFDIEVDGKVADGPSTYTLDDTNPTFNRESDLLEDLTVDSIVEIKFYDYDESTRTKQPTEEVQVPLPASALDWDENIFGSEGKYGEVKTYHLKRSGGAIGPSGAECDMKLQVYAEECLAGEYVTNPAGPCKQCPKGFSCKDGRNFEFCPSGTFQDELGGIACKPCGKGTAQAFQGQTFCMDCNPGHYQDEEGKSLCRECKGGHWGKGGSIASTCDGVCEAGHYCPRGSTSSKENECGSGSTGPYCPAGSKAPLSCPAGYYTYGETETTPSAIKICEVGYACPGDGKRNLCDGEKDQFSNREGASSCTSCGSCSVNEYRTNCTETEPGRCLLCAINETNSDAICGKDYEYEACTGETLSDISRCTKAKKGVHPGVIGGIAALAVVVIGLGVFLGMRHRKKLKYKLQREREEIAHLQTEQSLNQSLTSNVNPMVAQTNITLIDEGDYSALQDQNQQLKQQLREMKKDKQEKEVLGKAKVNPQPKKKKKKKKEFEVDVHIDKT